MLAGKVAPSVPGPVGSPAHDRALANPAVCGLYSNVAEWTSSWNVPYPGGERRPDVLELFRGQRGVRGGSPLVVEGKPWPPTSELVITGDSRFRQGYERDKALPGFGFRCARSLKPRFPQPPGSQ